ncbi:MAG: DUF1850 domain-containing protein [Synergistaceae bacterium]|jgi:hypothetical protein|nr:DUF1850 domain-containing protein [Synergistaceae bacterium]
MSVSSVAGQGNRYRVFPAAVVLATAFVAMFGCLPLGAEGAGVENASADAAIYLRIYDWKTGELYASASARIGSELFFGWIHSLEKIPWNEYYHVDENLRLILDAITFPAFGAGIPENKGKVCYVENGLIHMEEIDQPFEELVWLNSHTATQDIRIDGKHVSSGRELPQHTRLRLVIEKGNGEKRQ